MKQSITRCSTVMIAGVSLLALANMPAARAQSADLVLCDRIAADPADPDKPSDGLSITNLDFASEPPPLAATSTATLLPSTICT